MHGLKTFLFLEVSHLGIKDEN